jgi:hypothetical protein
MKFFGRKNTTINYEPNQVIKDWIIDHIIEEVKWAKDKHFITSDDYEKIKKILERK